MVILGIDPGTAIVGYAAIAEDPKNGEPALVDSGAIKPKTAKHSGRLKDIHERLGRLIDIHRPEAVAVEKIFFSKNIKTALSVAEARGVIILTAEERLIRVCEYTPGEVKLAVTGSGNADKRQVRQMVRLILKQSRLPRLDDVTDAIAIAIAALRRRAS